MKTAGVGAISSWLVRISMVVVLGMMGAGLAHADTYNFTVDHCTGSCGPSGTLFGTVTVSQNGSNDVSVNVSLNSPYEFIESGFDGTLGFNVKGYSSIQISGLSSKFGTNGTQAAGSHQFDGFESFQYVVTDALGNGASHEAGSSLVFNVIASGLTPAAFDFLSVPPSNGGQPVDFVADIFNSATTGMGFGNTGPVGALLGSQVVPEPGTLALFGSGLIALAGLVRRKMARV